ncbi:U4/U6-U5 snRNP complex subunit prp31, partial [Elasticomyces elasticus]
MSTAEELMRDFEEEDEDLGGEEGLQSGLQDVDESGEPADEEMQEQQQAAAGGGPGPGITNEFEVSVSANDELVRLHKVLRDHYSARFPRLDDLVSNPIDYAKTVAILQNGPLDNIKGRAMSMENMVGASLETVLGRALLMAVNIEGVRTKTQPLSETQLKMVLDTCEKILQLDRQRTALTESIQSRMNQIAPNLAVLVGPETAAQFLNQTGGLRELAKIPACNLAAQGSKKAEGLGFATNTSLRSQGFLYHSPMIQEIPNDLKRQAIRIVSAKMVLATRAD